MSSSSNVFSVGSVVLGHIGVTASWRRPNNWDQRGRYPAGLVITSSGEVEEGAYIPPASISIFSREGLMALRDAIDEALKQEGGSSC